MPPSWSLFTTVWSETCTPVTCWRSVCGALSVLLLFLLTQRSRYWSCCWVDALLKIPCPALLVLWPVSWYLLQALETELGDTANLFVPARMDVSWRSWTTCATWLGCRYRLELPLGYKDTREESVRKDKDLSVASTCKTISFWGVVLLLPVHCICCHFHLHQSSWNWFSITCASRMDWLNSLKFDWLDFILWPLSVSLHSFEQLYVDKTWWLQPPSDKTHRQYTTRKSNDEQTMVHGCKNSPDNIYN